MPSNTENLSLRKINPETDGNLVVNIETDFNDNWDKIDAAFGSSGHGHTGVAGDGPKIESSGLAAGAATDTVIGSRTVNDTTAPTGDSGTPATLFGWLGHMIKAITGGATWRTLPGMTIAAIKAILDGATNAGTAGTLMKRDANGRAQVADPSAVADIANKGYVDTAVSGTTIPDASLTIKGKVQLTSAVNSTSEALAATAKAVKDAYDRGSAGVTAATAAQTRANGALPKDGSEAMTGSLIMNAGFVVGANLAGDGSHWGLFKYKESGTGTVKDTALAVSGQGKLIHIKDSSAWNVWTENNDSPLVRGRAVTITGNMDFNNFQSPGVYDVVAFSGTNAPSGTAYGILKVYIDQYYLFQEFTENAPDHNRSFRTRTDSGVWSPWRTIQSHKLTSSSGYVINRSNTNLNDLILTGFYDGNYFGNAPNGSVGWFYVEVFRHYNTTVQYVLQRAVELEANEGRTYERRCLNGMWEEWKSVGGGIKNVQRGTTALVGDAPYYTDVTISPVNMSKTFVNVTSEAFNANTRFQLISSTVLRIFNNYGSYTVSWEVVEFY